MADITKTTEELARALDDLTRSVRGHIDIMGDSSRTQEEAARAAEVNTRQDIELQKIQNAARAEAKKSLDYQKAAIEKSIEGFKSLRDALLDTSTDLTKYTGATNDAIGVVGTLAKSAFPGLGKAIEVATKATQFMAERVLKQTENMVKAFDEVATLGAGAALTAENVANLGKQAGFSTGNLNVFVKNAKEAGSALVAMGGSASEGLKAFSQFTALGDEQLRKYRLLGLSQDRLMEMQTKYLDAQAKAGGVLAKTPQELQKASKGYIENMLVLAELSGKDVKQMEEAYAAAMAQENFNAYKFDQERKRADVLQQAKAAGGEGTEEGRRLIAEADKMQRSMEQKEMIATMAKAIGGKVGQGLLEMAASEEGGVYTEGSAAVAMLGIQPEQFMEMANRGELTPEQMDKFRQQIGGKIGEASSGMGQAAYFAGGASRELQGIMGLENSAREFAAITAKQKAEGISFEEAQARIKKVGETGKKDEEDKVMAAQAFRESMERKARLFEDEVIKAVNPFRTDILAAGAAAVALAGAAAAAAGALRGLPGAMGKATGMGGGFGAGAEAATGPAGAPAKGAGGLLRGAGRLAMGAARTVAPIALAYGAFQGIRGFTADQDASFGERLTNAGSSILSGFTGGMLGASPEEIAAKKEEAAAQKAAQTAASMGKTLDLIGKLESNGDYGIMYGGLRPQSPALTDMTVGQVLDYQRDLINAGAKSTAAGKYQVIRKTLAGLVQAGKVSLTDQFSPSTQDNLAIALMEGRGLQDFKAGKLPAETFANNLSKEWASLPYTTGKSYYEGDGLNKSLISRDEFMSTLQARNGGIFSGPESGYPVTLHGKEAVINKINPNSIFEALASTPVGQESTKLMNSAVGGESTTQIMSAQASMMQGLASKLDSVINQLEISNDIQDKMYKYAVA